MSEGHGQVRIIMQNGVFASDVSMDERAKFLGQLPPEATIGSTSGLSSHERFISAGKNRKGKSAARVACRYCGKPFRNGLGKHQKTCGERR